MISRLLNLLGRSREQPAANFVAGETKSSKVTPAFPPVVSDRSIFMTTRAVAPTTAHRMDRNRPFQESTNGIPKAYIQQILPGQHAIQKSTSPFKPFVWGPDGIYGNTTNLWPIEFEPAVVDKAVNAKDEPLQKTFTDTTAVMSNHQEQLYNTKLTAHDTQTANTKVSQTSDDNSKIYPYALAHSHTQLNPLPDIGAYHAGIRARPLHPFYSAYVADCATQTGHGFSTSAPAYTHPIETMNEVTAKKFVEMMNIPLTIIEDTRTHAEGENMQARTEVKDKQIHVEKVTVHHRVAASPFSAQSKLPLEFAFDDECDSSEDDNANELIPESRDEWVAKACGCTSFNPFNGDQPSLYNGSTHNLHSSSRYINPAYNSLSSPDMCNFISKADMETASGGFYLNATAIALSTSLDDNGPKITGSSWLSSEDDPIVMPGASRSYGAIGRLNGPAIESKLVENPSTTLLCGPNYASMALAPVNATGYVPSMPPSIDEDFNIISFEEEAAMDDGTIGIIEQCSDNDETVSFNGIRPLSMASSLGSTGSHLTWGSSASTASSPASVSYPMTPELGQQQPAVTLPDIASWRSTIFTGGYGKEKANDEVQEYEDRYYNNYAAQQHFVTAF
ncbi:hypothetical protein BDQ12DRAFT_724387 [Crucibulum laeve]|uniref:Uncharacterized protein n=1 Tax=Crucibulum laeve TaxID=68775 RepID=A0A5C3LVJ5_9AGAR|nr:hypothetical protein BDQ12DRAFT_724387 [Crucibulum laeve]